MSIRTTPFTFTTLQDLFDTMYHGIVDQGSQALDLSSGICQYRTTLEDGKVLGCAVGQLMTDEQADGLKGIVYDYDVRNLLEGMGILYGTQEFALCRDMQQAHDRASSGGDDFVNYWRRQCEDIAKFYGLKFTSYYSREEQASAYDKVAELVSADPSKLIAGAMFKGLSDFGGPSGYCAVGAFYPALGLGYDSPGYSPGYISPNGVRNEEVGLSIHEAGSGSNQLSYRDVDAEKAVLGKPLWVLNDSTPPQWRADTVADACRRVAEYIRSKKGDTNGDAVPEAAPIPLPLPDPMPEPLEVTEGLEVDAPAPKAKREPAKGSKRWWAKHLRVAAKLLESPNVTHVQGGLGAIDDDGNGCACAWGAINKSAFGDNRFSDSAYFNPLRDNHSSVAEPALRAAIADAGHNNFRTIIDLNDAPGGFAIGPDGKVLSLIVRNVGHFEVCSPEHTAKVCKVLRDAAFRLEHGGKPGPKARAGYKANKTGGVQ